MVRPPVQECWLEDSSEYRRAWVERAAALCRFGAGEPGKTYWIQAVFTGIRGVAICASGAPRTLVPVNQDHPVAVVCGGSAGIGLASAEALAAAGFQVGILGRDRDRLDRAVDRIGRRGNQAVRGWAVDAAHTAQVEAGFEAVDEVFGTVNALVNAVGPTVVGSFEALDDSDWERAFDQGTVSAVRTIRAALPMLRRAGWARIVNLTATSVQHQNPSLVAYTAAKTALASISKNLARSLAPEGILVNSVAPGTTMTNGIAAALRAAGGDPGDLKDAYRIMAERFGAHIDVGRVALPDEIARVVVFCASQENTFMTGAHINVDGGTDFV
jgi:3-oxoacyl-[acyl-carrier protein] reductase